MSYGSHSRCAVVPARIGTPYGPGRQRVGRPKRSTAIVRAVEKDRPLAPVTTAAWGAYALSRLSPAAMRRLARDVVWGRKAGELVAPAKDGRVTPAAITDLAEAAAAVLTQAGHDGEVFELTGPNAIGWHDVAKLAGVPFRAVPDDEYVAYLTGTFNLPDAAARQLTALYADFRGPWASTPTTTVADLIGRPALPGTEAVRRRVAMFPAG